MNPDMHIIFFAHPRSGSCSLYQVLELHPELNILEEPFNENFARWSVHNKNYRDLIHDIPSLERQLAEIFAEYNGVKVLEYQLPDELAVHMLQRPDCKIIFLRRRNLLQSIVSVLIAQQTHLWKKWDMTKPLDEYYRNLCPLDVRDVQRRVTELKQHLDFFESVIDARGDNVAIKLVYEDLYFAPVAQRDAQVAAIWKFLGIAPLESERLEYYLRPESVKINSTATYNLLPNARDIQQHCGNNMTGWLFEYQVDLSSDRRKPECTSGNTHTPTTTCARLFGTSAGSSECCCHFGVPLRGAERSPPCLFDPSLVSIPNWKRL